MPLPEPLKLYFAGPLFTQAEWLWNVTLAGALRHAGLDVILPQDGSVGMLNGLEEFDANAIFVANKASIESSDIVLAVLDQADADSGTAWECGFAFALGKRLIGIRTDLRRSTGDDGALNLMLSRSCESVILLPFAERSNVGWLVEQILAAIAASVD